MNNMFGNKDNFLEKKFSPLQYLTSVEGIFKLIAIVLIILSSALHTLYSSCGDDVPTWYPYLLPVGAGVCGIIVFLFYFCYITGIATNHFQTWSAMDIILNTICFLILLVVSILTLANCADPPNPLEFMFAPMSIIGALCIAISASVSLVKFRLDTHPILEENNDEIPHNVQGISAAQYRKSVVGF